MTEYITVKLTKKEAHALLHAAGNSLDHGDCMEAIFNNDKKEISAAHRADQKIREQLFKTRKP